MMQAFLSKLVTFGCAITLAFGTLSAHAGFDEGLAAYERGDYATALKEWRPLARQGHADAQYNLGVMYANGQGVPQDKVLAYALYNLSAAGDPSKDNNAPRNRESIAQGMSREAILAGQALTRELAKPGNFAQALDAHLKASRRPR